MRTVGQPGPEGRASRFTPEDGGAGHHQLGRDKDGRLDLSRDTLHNRFGTHAETQERQDEQLRRFRDAMKHAGEPDRDHDAPGRERLLATAGTVLPAGALPFPSVASAADAAPLAPGTAERVDGIVARVEQALQVELQRGPGEAIALRVDLGGAGDALSSVTVTLSADALDVVFATDAATTAPAVLAAAQALADRLHARFSGRVIRIREAVAETPAEPADGLQEIAALLRRPVP